MAAETEINERNTRDCIDRLTRMRTYDPRAVIIGYGLAAIANAILTVASAIKEKK